MSVGVSCLRLLQAILDEPAGTSAAFEERQVAISEFFAIWFRACIPRVRVFVQTECGQEGFKSYQGMLDGMHIWVRH